jgi:hypothetical protein
MRHRQFGGTMVLVLLAITVLLFAGLGAATISSAGLSRSKSDVRNAVAFNAAQSALEIGITKAYVDLSKNSGVFTSGSGDASSTLNAIASGVSATYTITPSSDTSYAYVTGTATYSGKTRTIREFLGAKDYGVWNNAIFAGTGATGRSINGNVDIRGSVHMLGDGEPYTDTNKDGVWTAAESYTDRNRNGVWDPGESFTDTNGDGVWTAAEPYNDVNKNGVYDDPLQATELTSDLSGTGKIGNNYSGIDSTIKSSIPDIPKKNGVATLSAEVRVKHGQLALSGNATAGESGSVDGGSSKATLDGMFVNDGYGGNKGTANVYSDNGTTNSYDLSALNMTMPLLSGIGALPYTDDTGTVWSDHKTYLNTKSLSITETEVTSSTSSFSHSDGTNSISWNKTTGVLTINGIVKVPDGFQVGKKDTIYFDGKGTLWCPGTIYFDGNYLPASGKKFPTDTTQGVIAEDSIRLASGSGSSQLKMCGAFYAQNKISSQKQNQIAGTFVSNYFDMGTNVPNIYQVPTLKSNLPPAMPGKDPVIYLRGRSWRVID